MGKLARDGGYDAIVVGSVFTDVSLSIDYADVKGADFRGAVFSDAQVPAQLRKNGAIVD